MKKLVKVFKVYLKWVQGIIAAVRLAAARRLVHKYNLDVYDAEQIALVGNFLARALQVTMPPSGKGIKTPTKFNKSAVRRRKLLPHLQRAVIAFRNAQWPCE